ncbi:MAG: phosphate regulon transcriptional regulatory protein PhoB [Alphaproteobacteria bacterium]|nr:phosphate regulon transcriptional regulatory protein PhoB [Alphaproteobacteria bacterium]
MKPRILIVEDEADLVTMLRYNLENAGYVVRCAATGEEADLCIREEVPDLILLDWMLPELSGIELCRRWRARAETAQVPIVMMTARGEEHDRVRGLTTGADDYVVKPFSLRELLARVRALLRRASPKLVSARLRAGDIELDRNAVRVTRGGRQIRLGPTEYRLLEFFMSSPGRVHSRAHLLDQVWGHASDVEERTVDVHVGRLREALNRGRATDPIRTVRGAGYGFDPDPVSANISKSPRRKQTRNP